MNPEAFLDGSTLAMRGGMVTFGMGLALVAARARWLSRGVETPIRRIPAPALSRNADRDHAVSTETRG